MLGPALDKSWVITGVSTRVAGSSPRLSREVPPNPLEFFWYSFYNQFLGGQMCENQTHPKMLCLPEA